MLRRHEKSQSPGGHRINKWFLEDSMGREHLAVVGYERDTKDGHYSYRAQPPFNELQPLDSSNMAVRNQLFEEVPYSVVYTLVVLPNLLRIEASSH